ncbi:flagellar export chaperone FliS [Rhodoferax aquaticus]|uniref:Flagellar secretion chaperone FliS n=1 Tax=Rhodoferax aquaticus TaxID=2527691 RepID=A0A515ETW3_9BURK|nr:flagellar export chaperone FliS [Rhodoferax aquaticus]QDL56091.1 flagellar export chaperone FliS [Rhodoferax aquaticus]
MFSSVSSRSASAYKKASIDASVEMADPHQLVNLLFNALRQALGSTRIAMGNGDVPAKCKYIGNAIRILEEGLKAPLDMTKGGELAANLNALYEYCVNRLITANARNDVAAIDEVDALIEKVASGWRQINGQGPAYLKSV